MQKSKCPVCGSDVVINDDAFEGDIVECAICNSISEIVSLNPATLNLVEEGPKGKEEE